MPLFMLFIVIPLIELGIFMTVGSEIGLVYTLLLCFLTALIGGYFVRQQGLDTLFKGRQSLNEGYLPVEEIFDGFCIVIAGALLMTPGFLTDMFGFSLLIPPVRVRIRKVLENRIHIFTVGRQNPPPQPGREDIVEGEFERLDDQKPPQSKP